MTTFELSSFSAHGRFLFWARLRSLVYIQIKQTKEILYRRTLLIDELKCFKLNVTFVHRQRNQIQLTQTLLTDGTSQKMSFLW